MENITDLSSGSWSNDLEQPFDGLLVDWDNYTPTVSTIGDLWGHEYNVSS